MNLEYSSFDGNLYDDNLYQSFSQQNQNLKPPIKQKNGISIEPRLVEYVEKREFQKKNNLKNVVPLKIVYQITQKDIPQIKKYIKEKKKFEQKNLLQPHDIFKNRHQNMQEISSYDNYLKTAGRNADRKDRDYKSISEHAFQYINPAIINPELTIEPWTRGGISTRTDNKKSSRRNIKKREIF